MTSLLRIELIAAALLAACVEPHVTVCAGGRVCPEQLRCDEIHTLCVHPDQLTACSELADGVICDLPTGGTGTCDQNVCIANVCGDGLVTGLEECEPGISTAKHCIDDFDYYADKTIACTNACAYPVTECGERCGDGVLQVEQGEVCEGDQRPPGSCLDYGFDAGRLECSAAACGPTLGDCRSVGFIPLFSTEGLTLNAAYVAAVDHIFISQDNQTMFELTGSTVTRTQAPAMNDFWGIGATTIYSSTYGGRVYRYESTGWTQVFASPTDESFAAIWGSGPNDIYVVGESDQVYRYNGTTWSQNTPGIGASWTDVHGISATDVFVVGSFGSVQRKNGAGWIAMNPAACWGANPAPTWTGVWSTSPTSIHVIGPNGLICHFNGATWTVQPSGVTAALTSIWGRAANDIYVVGDAGTVLHYDGSLWRRIDVDYTQIAAEVTGLGDRIVITGPFGLAVTYSGATFTTDPLPSPPPGLPETRAVVAGPSGALYTITGSQLYRRAPTSWVAMRAAAATYQYTGLWASGTSGVAVELGFTSSRAIHFTAPSTIGTPRALPIAEFKAIDGRSANDVYVVGSSQVGRFDGANWTVMTTLSGFARDIAVGPTTLWVVGNVDFDGFAARYEPATGWTTMPLPTDTPQLAAVWAASDTSAYAVGLDGTILHSDGTTWTRMDSGTLVNIVGIDGSSDTDVFAVTRGGVLLHYDGVGWSPIRPLAPVPDLAIDVHPNHVVVGAFTHQLQLLLRTPIW